MIKKDIVIPSGQHSKNIYLSKDIEEYNLDFSQNTYDRIIQLSKANMLDELFEEEKKEPEKPLYKLKMFQNVGSKVAEGLKKFKTYKPHNSINCLKEKI